MPEVVYVFVVVFAEGDAMMVTWRGVTLAVIVNMIVSSLSRGFLRQAAADSTRGF